MNIYYYLFIILLLICSCQSKRTEGFEKIEATIDSLKEINNFNEAVRILEEVKADYPSNEYEIIQELALLNGRTGEYEKSFKLWNDGHKKGYFFGLFSHFPIYKPFKKFPQFDSICKEDMRIRNDSLASSKTIYEIITPKKYDTHTKYPLLIILHGGGSSIQKEKKFWNSERLKNAFIVAFIQSYLYYDMTSFSWGIADERARDDLRNCYNEIKEIYSIDTTRTIIAGISAGAYTAMDISINKIITTSGFIAMCPDVLADDFNLKSIKKAKLSGLRGVIISGENDHTLENQKELLKKFDKVKLHYSFETIQGAGHEYPESFEARLYSAINFIQNNFPILTAEYLGQNKPGINPEIFAPGIVSTSAKEFAITFSPDGKEFYFTRSGGEMKLKTNTIFVSKFKNNSWSEPKIASSSGKYFDFEPHITPDGNKLYFGSRRPLNDNDSSVIMRQWYLERTPIGWSSPKLLLYPFNDFPVMYISVTMNGNLYFSVDTYEAGIWYSKYSKGKYEYPVKLPDQINYLPATLHPFISPDESFLLFDAKPDGFNTDSDLYISFRTAVGSWTKAKKLGNEINVSQELCPSISSDRKYLFFSRDGDIYWVDNNIIFK